MTGDNGQREDDSGMTDHDRLIRVDVLVQKLDRCMNNHLKHHREDRLAVRGALVTALLSLLVILLSAYLLTRGRYVTMATPIVEIADAVVTGLNAAELSMAMTAVRAYAREEKLPDMDELHVTVAPRGVAGVPGSRGQQQFDYVIDLIFQKAVSEEADADALVVLVQEAAEWLYARRVGPSAEAMCIRTANEPLLDVDQLRELRQFTSTLRTTYRL